MTSPEREIERFEVMLDRHGANFDAWPHPEEARAARVLVLSDPRARSAFEAARRLDSLLAARADAAVAEAERDTLVERTIVAVVAALPAPSTRTRETRRWIGLAASFVIAGFLGSAFDHFVLTDTTADEFGISMLDTLVYGPSEVSFDD